MEQRKTKYAPGFWMDYYSQTLEALGRRMTDAELKLVMKGYHARTLPATMAQHIIEGQQ